MKFVRYVFHSSSSPYPGRGKRRFAFGIWAALVAVAVIVGSVSVAVPVEASIYYLKSKTELADSALQNSGYTPVVAKSDATLEWSIANAIQVVAGTGEIKVEKGISVTADTILILCDEATLTVTEGITIADGKTLTIYAGKSSEGEITQASEIKGTGKLTVTGTAATESAVAGAGIGTATGRTATLVINGGEVSITGGESNQAGDNYKDGGIGIDVATVTINGETVTVAGGSSTNGTAGADFNGTVNEIAYTNGVGTYTVTFELGDESTTTQLDDADTAFTLNSTNHKITSEVTFTYATKDTVKATEPKTVPTSTEGTFKYWYSTDENTQFDFDNTNLTESITLNAKYELEPVITLNLGETATFTATATDWSAIKDGKSTLTITSSTADTITLPTPTRDNYAFAGWTGGDLTKPTMTVEITTADVTADRTYTATWIKKGASATTAPSTTDPQVVYRSMILGGQIRVMFYVNIPTGSGLTAGDTCLMDFTVGNNTVTGVKSTKSMTETISGTEYTLYGYECPITSAQMADMISMKLRQDETVKDVLTTTITANTAENYLNSLISTVSNETYSNLGQAIRDYGHYVQLMLADEHDWGTDNTKWPYAAMTDTPTDYNTGDKTITAATTAVAPYAISLKKNGSATTLSTTDSITNMQFSLLLEDVTTIRLYMLPGASTTITKAEITEVDDTALAEATTLTIQDTDKTIDSKTGYKYVDITGIPAHELNKKYTVSITAGSDTYTVEVSALSYAHAVLDASTSYDTKMQNAVTALYYYYAATDAYVNPDNEYPDYVGDTDENYGD